MDERKIVHFSPGGHIINNGHVPLLTVYFDDDTSVNYIAPLRFWRATPDEIAQVIANVWQLIDDKDKAARIIIRKLEMQPEGNSTVT